MPRDTKIDQLREILVDWYTETNDTRAGEGMALLSEVQHEERCRILNWSLWMCETQGDAAAATIRRHLGSNVDLELEKAWKAHQAEAKGKPDATT